MSDADLVTMLRDSDSVGRAMPLEQAAARIEALHHALDRACYALFVTKRLVDAGPVTQDHVRAEYSKWMKVLEAE